MPLNSKLRRPSHKWVSQTHASRLQRTPAVQPDKGLEQTGHVLISQEVRQGWWLEHLFLLFSGSVTSNSVTPWTAAQQASLSFTLSQSLLKIMCIESMMSSNHLVFCLPLLLLLSIFPSMIVISSESALRVRWPKCWSFSFNICPSNKYSESESGPQERRHVSAKM